MSKTWNESDDECMLAFWKLFEKGEKAAVMKRLLEARFEKVPSAATLVYRLDRARIRPAFVRVVGDETRVDAAFSGYERRKRGASSPVRSVLSIAIAPVPALEPAQPLARERPSYLCVGKDETCTNRKTRGSYCHECGIGIYQSPAERESWNATVAGQVGAALGRLRRG